MKTETKQEIFCLLTLILGATTSVLVLWTLHHFGISYTEVDDPRGYILPFIVWTAIASVPWAYLLDYVFRLFENKNSKNT